MSITTITTIAHAGDPIENRYDFVILFDVENGNPNGDPDAGNAPRIDPETMHGLVSDVCIKRKVRNYVDLVKDGAPGYNILIKPDKSLNEKYEEAYDAEGLEKNKEKKVATDVLVAARNYMCRNYFDVRTFGMVMTTGKNWCGKVTGPVQINFARSISPIYSQEISITRQARTTEERTETGETEMGRKTIIPYALYRAEGYVSAPLAKKSGFSEADVELLWEAITNMFEHDHSAARGKMAVRGLYIFKHDSELGNCASWKLFDKIRVEQRDKNIPPRHFSDYVVSVDETLPDGVELIVK